ncbi:MAG: hypothetical protein CL504_09615 [Actinobacteria bacterium]|nr:hypothetical protein [Actinomycetota bacterium]
MKQLKLTECGASPVSESSLRGGGQRAASTLRLLCIDPGIHNMGLALVAVSPNGFDSRAPSSFYLEGASCTDITIFPCTGTDCKLRHEATMADWVAHFIQANAASFAMADIILIERQPPQGFRCCEQLLFSQFRDKVKLIHPRSVHTFFGMSYLNYEQRKKRSVELAIRYYAKSASLQCALERSRAHDISDAMMMAVYFQKNLETQVAQAELPSINSRNRGISEAETFLDQFCYVAKKDKF